MPRSPGSAPSDEELLRRCRNADSEAFAELWERHRRAGLVAARNLAPRFSADDLVSEAYLRIFELTRDGRGPRGAFRPYLYQVIRSIAADWWRSPEHANDALDEIPDLTEAGPWEDGAFDRNAAAQAFATLNERWQAVLWYTEVEGMTPREAAKLLGISANGVSALAARAREALQSAWVEAHVNREIAAASCRSTLQHLQRYQRGKLTRAASRDVAAHLDGCDSCAKAAAEYSTLNRQLALVIAGVLLGAGPALALLESLNPIAAAASTVGASAGAGTGTSTAASAGGTGTTGAGAGATSGGAAAAGAGAGVLAAPVVLIAATAVAAVAIGGGAFLLSGGPPRPTVESAAETAPVAPLSQTQTRESTGSDDGREPSESQNTGADDSTRAYPDRLVQADATASADASAAAGGGSGGTGGADAGAGAGGRAGSSGDAHTANATSSARADGGSGTRADGSADADRANARAAADARSGADASTEADGSASAGADPGADTGAGADSGADTGADASAAADAGGADADGDDGDPKLTAGFECWFRQGDPDRRFLRGEASEPGVVRARIAQPPGAYVLLPEAMQTQSQNRWWSSLSLTPLSQWPGLVDGELFDATVELQLSTPDGRRSPWTAAELVDTRCPPWWGGAIG